MQQPGAHADHDEPLEIFRACQGAVLKAKTLKSMRTWEEALITPNVTRTGNRQGITATLNGDRTYSIEHILDNC